MIYFPELKPFAMDAMAFEDLPLMRRFCRTTALCTINMYLHFDGINHHMYTLYIYIHIVSVYIYIYVYCIYIYIYCISIYIYTYTIYIYIYIHNVYIAWHLIKHIHIFGLVIYPINPISHFRRCYILFLFIHYTLFFVELARW